MSHKTLLVVLLLVLLASPPATAFWKTLVEVGKSRVGHITTTLAETAATMTHTIEKTGFGGAFLSSYPWWGPTLSIVYPVLQLYDMYTRPVSLTDEQMKGDFLREIDNNEDLSDFAKEKYQALLFKATGPQVQTIYRHCVEKQPEPNRKCIAHDLDYL